jgi:hypothetical protein
MIRILLIENEINTAQVELSPPQIPQPSYTLAGMSESLVVVLPSHP